MKRLGLVIVLFLFILIVNTGCSKDEETIEVGVPTSEESSEIEVPIITSYGDDEDVVVEDEGVEGADQEISKSLSEVEKEFWSTFKLTSGSVESSNPIGDSLANSGTVNKKLSNYSGLIINPEKYQRYTTLRTLEGLLLSVNIKDAKTIDFLVEMIKGDNYLSVEEREDLSKMVFNKEKLNHIFSYINIELLKVREDNIDIEPTLSEAAAIESSKEEDVFFSVAWDYMDDLVYSYSESLREIEEGLDVAQNLYKISDNYVNFYRLMREVEIYKNVTVLENYDLFTGFFTTWNSVRKDMAPPYFKNNYEFVDNIIGLADSIEARYLERSNQSRSYVWFSEEERSEFLLYYICDYYLSYKDDGKYFSALSDKRITEFSKHLKLRDEYVAVNSSLYITDLVNKDYTPNKYDFHFDSVVGKFQYSLNVPSRKEHVTEDYMRQYQSTFFGTMEEKEEGIQKAVEGVLLDYKDNLSQMLSQTSRRELAYTFFRIMDNNLTLSSLGYSLQEYLDREKVTDKQKEDFTFYLDSVREAYLLPFENIFLKDGKTQINEFISKLNVLAYNVSLR